MPSDLIPKQLLQDIKCVKLQKHILTIYGLKVETNMMRILNRLIIFTPKPSSVINLLFT